jgi:thioester reductase-like protein
MASPIYFITGTTGFLGAEVLRTILAQDPDAQCYCLVREFSLKRLTVNSDRIIPVIGDITLSQLGLSDGEYQALAKKITHIIHSAAVVQFEKPKAFLEAVNVEGARNMIAFANTCKQHNPEFKVYGHVSTAYVAGKRKGIVTEEDFSEVDGFKNNYEATKFAAEKLVHEAKNSLPVIIFRPSIILGHSIDGSTPRTNVLFPLTQVVKKYPINILMLPFYKNCLLDLVPVDYVAQSIYFIVNSSETIGQVFHLTSGQGKELTIKQVVKILEQVYRKHMIFVPTGLWHIAKPILSYSRKGIFIVKATDPFWLYTVSNPQFCKKATQKFLDQFGVNCSLMEDVLKKTLLYLEK